MSEKNIICNLCGLSCKPGDHEYSENSGLLNVSASGGYWSTPGNGNGALDDSTSYKFSLCEFCLDWMFSKFKIPVKLSDYMNPDNKAVELEVWRPAKQRAEEDSWRRFKDEWLKIYNEREAARMEK